MSKELVVYGMTRNLVIQKLSSEAVGIRSIGRLLGCSASYVVKLIKLIASKVKRPVPFEYGQEYELDEIWSYEGKKRMLADVDHQLKYKTVHTQKSKNGDFYPPFDYLLFTT